jgi:hypothetical protein
VFHWLLELVVLVAVVQCLRPVDLFQQLLPKYLGLWLWCHHRKLSG